MKLHLRTITSLPPHRSSKDTWEIFEKDIFTVRLTSTDDIPAGKCVRVSSYIWRKKRVIFYLVDFQPDKLKAVLFHLHGGTTTLKKGEPILEIEE